MGNTLHAGILCPNCKSEKFYPLRQSIEEITNHIKNCYKIKCPHCSQATTGFITGKELAEHIQRHHNTKVLCCPVCNLLVKNEEFLIEHFLEVHQTKITCPICSKNMTDETDFIEHLEASHSRMFEKCNSDENTLNDKFARRKKEIMVGDRVLVLSEKLKWEYFPAIVKRLNEDSLTFEINGCDNESERTLDYFNLIEDKSPSETEIGIGSSILFAQGVYQDSKTGIEVQRWHEGSITNICTFVDGSKSYEGHHTKSEKDGKCINYSEYSPLFTNLSINELRIRQNVFEMIDRDNSHITENEIFKNEIALTDIFFSYNIIDSYTAYKNGELENLIIPETYITNYTNMCDPYEIKSILIQAGYNVIDYSGVKKVDFRNVSSSIQKSKVFIACISDAYVKDESCKMQFEFAKTKLHKPVVPLVVGDGSFSWVMSVIGMLIAGELFIHFREKATQNEKCNELLTTLSNLIKANKNLEKNIDEPIDVFISYCWKNSYKAEEIKQIEQSNGSKFADPRLLKDMIKQLGYKVWIDIEQLSSANADSGLFGQITDGIKSAKVVIPCISDDYSKSANCRMEFQFALKSLNKTIIPVVVGKGNDWKLSVVGALLSSYDSQLINMQDVYDHNKLNKVFKKIKSELRHKISQKSSYDMMKYLSPISLKREIFNTFWKKSNVSRTPKVGDRVICHHVKWAYCMAKVVNYNNLTMKYTVDWEDGDFKRSEVLFNEVALDVAPEITDIGVGSTVIFPQGFYTKGNVIGVNRYHEGEITSVNVIGNTVYLNGHHSKGEDNGKWINYDEYNYNFNDMPLTCIRLPPTALETIYVGALKVINNSI
ncbi:uncharacterized protein LOC124807920 [Hydra vulgaris]|uniref:uncharacterized protein LOC124807920 n=1 Tax=Hydra vulgaris TaxID=6087 RepID=UPI001F5F2E96|nr:uncharacterized protein LOC124807920 [Hydra vulgaris]